MPILFIGIFSVATLHFVIITREIRSDVPVHKILFDIPEAAIKELYGWKYDT